MSSIATQAALVSGFAFTAVNYGPGFIVDTETLALGYFFYFFFTSCLVAALFVLSQATIVVMFGPTMALKGSSDNAVKYSAKHMLNQQYVVFKAAALSISSFFFGAVVFTWISYPDPGICTITTFIYMVGYYFVWTEGKRAYFTFVPSNDGDLIDPAIIEANGANDGKNYSKVNQEAEIAERIEAAKEVTKMKLKAILWKRQSIEEGGVFEKYFAVLEKGRLDFYRKESDYRDNSNPVNTKPIKLWCFNLETDPRKYARHVTSLTSALKSSVLGNEDFNMSDLITSEYDLQMASRNYKFGLIPKVSSELTASVHFEFLAHDEKSYKQWTTALQSVISAYDEIAATPSIEHTIRVGNSDVEMVVQAANN